MDKVNMKLVQFLNKPKSFNNLMRQSLDALSGITPHQLRHHLKENWDTWVEVINEKKLYDNIDSIIYIKYSKNIKNISNTKPCDIKLTKLNSDTDIEDTYNKIYSIIESCDNLTMNALMWATLCNSSGDRMKLDAYLKKQNHDYSKDILEIFMIMNHDDLINESIDLNAILQKLGFSFNKEAGLIQILHGAGKHIFSLFKALIIAWYSGKEEDKQVVRDIIDSTDITKEHIVDFLFKLDEVTLHLLTGPVYLLSAITGWKIRPIDPHKKITVQSIETKIKDAINQLSTITNELPKKIAKNFRSYLKGISNLVCRDLGVCSGEQNEN